LLEILLASAILAAALSVLAQQNATGVQAALRSQLESEAAMHCQSLLNKLLAEGLPTTDVNDEAVSQNSRWRWSAKSAPSQFSGLRLLTVTVYQNGANQQISTQSLSRLVPNSQPEIRP
jgi:hypothetical protein